MTREIVSLKISYGRDGEFHTETLAKRLLAHYRAPDNIADLAGTLRDLFLEPIEFPQLRQACVAGDRVVIALDDETPRSDAIIALLWRELSAAGIGAADVTILQPARWEAAEPVDPRSLLPKDLQSSIELKRHDPTVEDGCGYLASTASGERIYLATELIEADLVIPVGKSGFDPLLGVRGEASVLYPAFSNTEAIKRTIGHGHDELSTTDSRPLRQQVEEVGWLLGTQFVVSVLPGTGTGVQAVFAGQTDAVTRHVRAELEANNKLQVCERAEMVIVAVEQGSTQQSWDQVAAAIDVARRVVERDGRIVVLSQLNQPRGPGLDLLAQVRNPHEAINPIAASSPPDYLAATRISKAAEWANIYLLSQLPAEQIEDLFLIPLANETEAEKLLTGDDTKIIIESAQNVFAACD